MTERSGIICAGNWIVDMVHAIGYWPRESELVRIGEQSFDIGGGAANVVAALTKLDTGLPLWPMGAVGEDEHGRYVLRRCKEMGLPSRHMQVKGDTATAHTHVMSVPGQTRTFFYQGGANDALTVDDFPEEIFTKNTARIFYLGYPMLLAGLDEITPDGTTGAARVLYRAKTAGMITCVDLVSTDDPGFADSVGHSLPYIDYLVLNEIEAAHATRRVPVVEGEIPSDEALTTMARELIEAGVNKAVVLHCPDKVLWTDKEGDQKWAPTKRLAADEIASPLGAGDAFCAGLLYAIHEYWPLENTLALANATARASLKGVTACEAIPNLKELECDVIRMEEIPISP
ncbi:carbohydrate kinase family protein [Phaeobacter sp. C3_T13_0]|uniref:carbohydrate kinase family protein n=1 Tax=Phaeobacter cretensis TaxID=3342641 RepID=UPI0039BC335B